MAITLDNSGVTFGDSTVNVTASKNSGKLISINSFQSAGTFTWSRPAGCSKVFVQVQGAGGGGCGYCESGGAGGYAEMVIDVTSVPSVTVTVGGGGVNTGYHSAAGRGGTSSFGGYVSASGGYGANNHVSHTGGHGGIGSGGQLNITGGNGTGHGDTGGREAVGTGSKSFFGSGYKASHSTNTSNLGYTAPGAGGAGGAMQGWAGSYGGPGIVVVYNYS
jgi:hypothetical protein